MKYFWCITMGMLLTLKAQQCEVEGQWLWNQIESLYNAPISPHQTKDVVKMRYIPFTIHWVKNTNGTPGNNSSLNDLYYSFIATNRMLNSLGIQLYIAKDINIINNSNYLNVVRGSAEHQQLLAMADPTTANIWVVDGWQGSPSSGWGGPTSGIELADITLGTFPHECGHFLGLAHTFDTSLAIEEVSRDGNCLDAGDRICDTDADPYQLTVGQISGEVLTHSHCTMTSNTRDANGTLYTPPFNNIMSYYGGSCGFEFTAGQMSKMNQAYDQWHNNYNPAIQFTAQDKPTNLQLQSNQNAHLITWDVTANSLGTIIEISSDNGSSWSCIGGAVEGVDEMHLGHLKAGNYLLRARYLNSLTYTSDLAITITEDIPVLPIVFNRDTSSLGSIAQFEIAGINLLQANNINNNYSIYDFSNGHDLIAGGTYDFRIKTKSNNSGAIPTYYGIWADLNQDGDFEDNGELLYHPLNTIFQWTVNDQFTIPSSANQGIIRLRVRCFSQANEMSADGIFSGSEIEDYIIKVVAEAAPYSLVATYDEVNHKADLVWQDDADQFTYTIERSDDGINFTSVGTTADGVNKTFTDQSLLGNKQYEYRVKRTPLSLYSNGSIINTPLLSPTFCTPTSTNPCSTGYDIKDFEVKLDASTQIFYKNSDGNCGATSPGFSDYSLSDSMHLEAQTLYFFNISNNNSGGFEHMKIYLDTNQNGVFEAGELIHQTDGTAQVSSGTFNIPSNALNGFTKMRVRGYFGAIDGACGDGSFGETEDYTVNITNGKVLPVTKARIDNVTDNVIDLSWERAFTNDLTGFLLESSMDGNVWTTLASLDTNVRSYQHTGLTSGQKYMYRITASAFKSSSPNVIWATTTATSSSISDDNTLEAIQMYPNPAQNLVLMSGLRNGSEIEVYNLQGQLIYQVQSKEQQLSINTSSWSRGLYLVHCLHDKKIQQLKLQLK